MAYSKSLDGPWTNLLPDGAAFFTDGNTSLGLSNPAAWPLANGSIVMAYSRAPNLGVAVAPHWKGPYTRLYLMTESGEKNYSLVNPHGKCNRIHSRAWVKQNVNLSHIIEYGTSFMYGLVLMNIEVLVREERKTFVSQGCRPGPCSVVVERYS